MKQFEIQLSGQKQKFSKNKTDLEEYSFLLICNWICFAFVLTYKNFESEIFPRKLRKLLKGTKELKSFRRGHLIQIYSNHILAVAPMANINH